MWKYLFAGLFHQAILQSGTANCPWALGSKFSETANIIGKQFGCKIEEGSKELLDCLQKVDASELQMNVGRFQVRTP